MHINMNANVRQKAKNNFKSDFFKLKNNGVFGKIVKNMKKT